MEYKCNICFQVFDNRFKFNGHKIIHSPKVKKPILKAIKQYICKHCGKEWSSGEKLGGHMTSCVLNPNSKTTFEKIALKATGRTHSNKTKEKIKRIVTEKIKNGTWHVSFAKRRIHEYRGMKFNGKWELGYAIWLDTNNIKWRQVKETFVYVFEDEEHRYTPDYYLEDEQCYVEVKGYETPKDRAKWSQFPFKLKVLKGKELKELGIIQSYKDVSK